MPNRRIEPCLWFDHQAEEVVTFGAACDGSAAAHEEAHIRELERAAAA
jgi:predicted 3-demethylubiquinone-9 3-methyltransferase (glyoxalase superfamily)